jgi:SnoaL-like protein
MNERNAEIAIDFDRQMQTNLSRVFNERDPHRRIAAIAKLYAEDATLLEPGSAVRGHAAINAAVTALLKSLPPDFAFTADGPALGHHDLGRLRWRAGPPGGPAAVNGMDIARFQAGLIKTLHVFIEPAAA